MSASDLDFGATIRAFSSGQRVFSRFSLVRLLGRGGMGVVWLAKDDKLEREVALKFLPEAVALDPRSVDDLKQETRRSLELTHPHIVRIYDFFEDNNAAAISMEYVEGGSLARLAVDQPLRCFEPAQIVQWLRQLVDALEYAHTKARIVHRDLKPANLMISEDGDLKITDFGISATVTDSMTRVSRLMSSGATPAYSSPQQVMGERPSAADDIYSLGATIFDLVTGKPPFHSGNLLVQVQSKTPETMRERRAELGVKGAAIPESWERVIAACLAKEPSQRPASARAVLDGLDSGSVVLGKDAAAAGITPAANIKAPIGPKTRDPDPAAADTGGGNAAGFGLALAMLKGARGIGGFGRWFAAVLFGRAGLLPCLAVLALPILLLLLAFLWFRSPGEPETVFNQPAYPQSGDSPGVISPQPAQPDPGSQVQFNQPAAGTSPPSAQTGTRPTSTPRSEPVVRTGDDPQRETGFGGASHGSSSQNQPSSPGTPTGRAEPAQAPAPVVAPPPMPATGAVEITSDPPGATVTNVSGGNEIGRTPLRLEGPPGAFKLALRLPGYGEAIVSGRIRADETTRLSAELKPVRAETGREHAITVPELGINLLWLQPGEFTLGSPVSESGPDSDEQPQTRVRFTKGFWIAATETTQGQWRTLMGSNPSGNKSGGDQAPVERVSWDDAARFCARLNDREQAAGRVPAGYVYRLPTEAEWEYGCRAGTTGPYSGELGPIAVTGRRNGSTRSVGSMQPNAWGLYDMHGNVAEWTNGWYGHYPGGSVNDYTGSRDGKVHVFRGGSYDSSARSTRAAYRGYVSGSTADRSRGFRVVLAPTGR
ncbi:MAG: protein kinase domain-containing protein [Opitutaceae bacterium]